MAEYIGERIFKFSFYWATLCALLYAYD